MNYHFVQQEDGQDCGWACLAMLIENFHHQRLTIYELKKNFHSSKETGLSFFDLLEIGKQYQLKGEGYHCDLELLSENRHHCPFLVNIKNQFGASHYVIFFKFENNYFYLNDPSRQEKIWKVPGEDFAKIFLNKILIFKKSGKLKNNDNWKIFQSWFLFFWRYLFFLVLLALLTNLFWIFASGFSQQFSQWINRGEINWKEVFLFGGFVLAGCFFEFWQEHFSLVLSQKTWTKLWRAYFWQKSEPGLEEQISKRNFNLLVETWEFFQLVWNLIVSAWTSLIFFPVLMFWISELNPLFCFLPCLLNLMIVFFKVALSRKFKIKKEKLQEASQNYHFAVNNYFQQEKTLQNRGLKKQFLKTLQTQENTNQRLQLHFNFQKNLFHFWEKFWVKIFYFLLLIFVFLTLKIKTFTGQNLLTLIILANYALTLLNQTTSLLWQFFTFKSGSQNLHWLKKNSQPEKQILDQVLDFSFSKVSWNTETSPELVLDENFKTSFFVQGKKTVVDSFFLFLASFQTQEGKITINGRNYQDFEDDFYLLIENQDLVNGTLIQNIFNWNSDLNPELFKTLNPGFWLKKYGIEWENNQQLTLNFNLVQKQIINFLAAFFSEAKVYLFKNCLDELEKEDQDKLLQLFLVLKDKCFVIFASQNLNLQSNFSQKLVLDPMI